MKAWQREEEPHVLATLIDTLSQRGVKLWSQDGQLRFKAPKGALGREDIENLQKFDPDQILALLEPVSLDAEPPLRPRQAGVRVPLSFSQFKYWHTDRLHERSTTRTVAAAMRMRGRLDLALLSVCIDRMIERHEALRTRIVMIDGHPVQLIDEPRSCDLAIDDLSSVEPGEQAAELERAIHAVVLAPIHVATGPLFAAGVLRLGEADHVLTLAMQHIVSDGASLNILLRDLFTAYTQSACGQPVLLPSISVQSADYAVWQAQTLPAWLRGHSRYWSQRLDGRTRLRFPDDPVAVAANQRGWSTVPVCIDTELKARLQEWCRRRHTTVVMAVFTAFVALVLRWCAALDAVVRYQTDGRFSPQVENTIGYFAAVLNLTVQLKAGDSFMVLLERVTREYCQAVDHADFSYFEAQVPRPEFTRSAGFNWIPQGAAQAPVGLGAAHEPLTVSPVSFSNPTLAEYDADYEPMLILTDQGPHIAGSVHFPLRRFSAATMERFGASFLSMLEHLLQRPEQRVTDLLLD